MKRLSSRLILPLVLALLLPSPARSVDRKPAGLSVVVGKQVLNLDPVALAAWLAYGGARVRWRQDHQIPIDPEHKIVVASFQEELAGRRALLDMWHTLLKSEPKAHDEYIETLDTVDKAGYLNEYVHTFLVPNPERKTTPPDSLSAFDEWRKQHLDKHTPETMLSIK